nr:zinc finger, CCHC-type, retrotransposon Gag domain protein [Tanacetum cinerariifolium]
VSEPGYETVGSKDLTCDDWMVNTRTDADLSAAVQNALQAMLHQIRKEIRKEFRTRSGSSNAGGNPPPVTIHTWIERFNKKKPHSFEKATAPVDAENWISHMDKIFDVMGCEDAFKTRLAVYKFEEQEQDDEHKLYSLFGFTWAFKSGSSFFKGAQSSPSYGHNMSTPNWQIPMPLHRATPNLQTPMPSHPRDVGLVNPGDKSMNKRRNANILPFNLGNAFVDDNVGADDVLITNVRQTDNYLMYENVDTNKVRRKDYTECMQFLLHPYPLYLDYHIMGYSVPELFWRELVPHLYMAGYHRLEDANTGVGCPWT